MIAENLPFVLALGVAGVASVTDIYNHKIYDYLTIPAIFLGIGLNLYLAPLELVPVAKILALPGAAFGFGYLLNRVEWWGGGDVKLVAALAAFIPAYAFQLMFFPFLFLIPTALVQAARHGGREEFTEREVEMPSAPFFLGAVIVSFFTSVLVV